MCVSLHRQTRQCTNDLSEYRHNQGGAKMLTLLLTPKKLTLMTKKIFFMYLILMLGWTSPTYGRSFAAFKKVAQLLESKLEKVSRHVVFVIDNKLLEEGIESFSDSTSCQSSVDVSIPLIYKKRGSANMKNNTYSLKNNGCPFNSSMTSQEQRFLRDTLAIRAVHIQSNREQNNSRCQLKYFVQLGPTPSVLQFSTEPKPNPYAFNRWYEADFK